MQPNPILYIKLLGITAVAIVVCMIAIIGITGSRETGMGYGLCAGIFVGPLVTSLLRKRYWLFAVIQILVYGCVLIGLLYAMLYREVIPLHTALSPLVIIVSIMVAFSVANYLAGKIVAEPPHELA